MMSDGGFVVAFHTVDLEGRSFEVMARRFNADGNAKADEFQMNAHTDANQKNVRIAAGPDGFFAVWQSEFQDGDGYGVYGRSYDAVYGEHTEEFMLTESGDGWQEFANVAAGGDGRFVVVWHEQGAVDYEIRARVHMPALGH